MTVLLEITEKDMMRITTHYNFDEILEENLEKECRIMEAIDAHYKRIEDIIG
jgi:hypothetical protein